MYSPSEDSYFLSSTIKKYLRGKNKNIHILDIGTGSGIQAETCLTSGFKNILAADINKEAIKYVKKKKIRAIKSNLFSKVKGKFDLIIFNPPYLPENKHDSKFDTTGGKLGDETILRFLKQAKNHLTSNGKILLLLSSFTPRKRINNVLEDYNSEKLAEKKLFFEKLEIFLISS